MTTTEKKLVTVACAIKGGLVLRLESGAETTVIAGDLEPGAAPEGCAR